MEDGVIRMAGKFASLIRKSIRRSIRRSLKPFDGQSLAHDTRGSEIAEAALVLPLMFMILLGIFWFGQAFRIYGTLAQAARVGARAGADPGCSTCNSTVTAGTNACNAIQPIFSAAHLDINKIAHPTTIPSQISCDTGSTVTGCDPSPCNVCVQAGVQLSSNATTSAAGVCGVSVTFQYPYQFWFPGTSLNNQTLQLRGGSQMRSESH
jgi:Flp pilus assembly protein TadG